MRQETRSKKLEARKILYLASCFLLLLFKLPSYAGDASAGEELFKKRCRQCHKTTEQLSTGPGLKNVTKRRDIEWIDRWLKDPKKMMDSSDPIAQGHKKNFKKHMPKIPVMSNDDKRSDIIEYLKTL
ncbi:MAG: c-type cytochrome [Nitrospinae bacterium]|nr:c-type cytochrome [Nitrospinota bacterium]